MSERKDQFRALYLDQRISHQATYYKDRAEEYKRAHRQAVVLRNALLFLAALVGVAAQLGDDDLRAGCAVAAAVLSALAGAVTAYDSLIGFPQLEKLYADAALNLEEAALDWNEPGATMADEVDRVEWVFRSERGQWGQLIVKSTEATKAAGQDDEDEPAQDPAVPDR